MKKIYFVTGNKRKTDIFNTMMSPDYLVDWFKPPQEIPELVSKSVIEVVEDKLAKAYTQLNSSDKWLFVTDVGLYINSLEGRPGALVKRETKSLGGDWGVWCTQLSQDDSREAYVQMIIAAKRGDQYILVDHKVPGLIPNKPLPGEYGFDWDEIFVPNEELVKKLEYKGRSFAQIPPNLKLELLMSDAIREFKEKLNGFKD